MDNTARQELREALGEEWLVVGDAVPPMQQPSWGLMRLFDFKRTLYVGKEQSHRCRWVLWDGRGDLFGGGDPFDATEMAKSAIVIDNVEHGDLFECEDTIYIRVDSDHGGLCAVDASDGELIYIPRGTAITAIYSRAEINLNE